MMHQGVDYAYGRPMATTVSRHEALIVSFLPASGPHPIGCLVSRIEACIVYSAGNTAMRYRNPELKRRLEKYGLLVDC